MHILIFPAGFILWYLAYEAKPIINEDVKLHWEEKITNKRVNNGLTNFKDDAYLSKELVTIIKDVELEYKLDDFIIKSGVEEVINYLEKNNQYISASGKIANFEINNYQFVDYGNKVNFIGFCLYQRKM